MRKNCCNSATILLFLAKTQECSSDIGLIAKKNNRWPQKVTIAKIGSGVQLYDRIDATLRLPDIALSVRIDIFKLYPI